MQGDESSKWSHSDESSSIGVIWSVENVLKYCQASHQLTNDKTVKVLFNTKLILFVSKNPPFDHLSICGAPRMV